MSQKEYKKTGNIDSDDGNSWTVKIQEKKKKGIRKNRLENFIHKKYMKDLPFAFGKSSLLKKNCTNVKSGPI